MAERMAKLVVQQKEFLGVESAQSEGLEIIVSYWGTEENIRQWKQQEEHLQAQHLGKIKWYEHYAIRVCKVERAYSM